MIKLEPRTESLIWQWCKTNLPEIQPVDRYDPPWKVFKQQRADGIVKVFNGGADVKNMIFNSHSSRYYYRAWHDSLHLKHDIPFGDENELLLANIQKIESLALGISRWDSYLLGVDLYCHIKHYMHHKKHPEYQAELVADYLILGEAAFISDYSIDR